MNILERISCHHFVEVDGYAYFSNWFYNGLFKVEIENGNTTFLGHFAEEGFSKRNIHKEILLKGNKIYFFPRRGRHVHIYDLADQAMKLVEIRAKQERAFAVEEVFIEENSIFFIPQEDGIESRKLDLGVLNVMKIKECPNFSSQPLSKCYDYFPDYSSIENYHIEHIDKFTWKCLGDKTWYGFLPLGRRLLRYSEETHLIDTVPLSIINKVELQKYLSKVSEELLKEKLILEQNWSLDVSEFLDALRMRKVCEGNKPEANKCMGTGIWEMLLEH